MTLNMTRKEILVTCQNYVKTEKRTAWNLRFSHREGNENDLTTMSGRVNAMHCRQRVLNVV